MPDSSVPGRFSTFHRRLKGAGLRGAIAGGLSVLLLFLLVGLVYNAVAILRLPQSGLKAFEIVWVSLTACVLLIALAMAIAAGVEHLGEALRPKPPGEEWLRNQVRHGRVAGIEVGPPPGEAKKSASSGASSAA